MTTKELYPLRYPAGRVNRGQHTNRTHQDIHLQMQPIFAVILTMILTEPGAIPQIHMKITSTALAGKRVCILLLFLDHIIKTVQRCPVKFPKYIQ